MLIGITINTYLVIYMFQIATNVCSGVCALVMQNVRILQAATGVCVARDLN